MRGAERLLSPLAEVVRAARRPSTYAGHVKELSSTFVTAGMWPLGIRDDGPSRLPFAQPDGGVPTPVLLVHGFGANKSNWLFVSRYLNQAGFGRLHALNYNPFTADIPALAGRCAERAEALKAHFGVDRIHVIGHSLGGIIARYAVQVHGLAGVDVCVTVAAPHGGVLLAGYGSPFAVVSPLASWVQLRADSSVMRQLRATVRPLPTRFVAYYSNLDMVVPARRAMILEPELQPTNIFVKDHGHLSIMLSRTLASSIVDQLAAAEGLPGYGNPVGSLAPTSSASGEPRGDDVRDDGARSRPA